MAALPPDLHALLVEQVRDQKRGLRNGAYALLAIMAIGGVLGEFAVGGRDGRGIAILAALGSGVGFLFLVMSLGDPAKAAGIRTLETRAGEIVWLYVLTQGGRSAGSWIVMGLEDGSRVQLTTIMGREQEVLGAVSKLAPQASVGFTPARKAQFAKAPRELRRLVR